MDEVRVSTLYNLHMAEEWITFEEVAEQRGYYLQIQSPQCHTCRDRESNHIEFLKEYPEGEDSREERWLP